MSAPQDDPGQADGHPRKWAVLAVLGAVGFMAQLDLFIVTIAVPAIGASFPEAGLGGLSWVLNAYAVAFGALLVPAGRYADRYGRRSFLLSGVAVFTVASAACAAAPTLPVLVAARVLQAVGAAAVLPTSLALLYPAFPARQHPTVVGIWTGLAAVAATAGPAVGGLLVALDWRWIFVVNLPIGIAVLLAGARLLPRGVLTDPAPPPRAGSVLLALAAVSLLVLATVQLPTAGWLGTVLLGAASLAIAAGVRSTLRGTRPLVEPELFRTPGFGRAAVALLLFFVAFGAWLLIGALFLQRAWGYSALLAGVALAPGPLAAAVFALSSGRVVARFGPTLPAVAGPLFVAAAGLYWLLLTPQEPAYLTGFLPGQVLGGIGSGLTQAPLFAAAGALPANRVTTGSALLNMARQTGSALGVALLAALLAGRQPAALATFHGGWLLGTVAALAAPAVHVGRRGVTPRSATMPGPVLADPGQSTRDGHNG